ncbi:MAG TPA: hypothetical protein VHO66_00010 [Ruminiclostridium sp.]|nr:hypothetical protein [Ruminiclostridium sp.]
MGLAPTKKDRVYISELKKKAVLEYLLVEYSKLALSNKGQLIPFEKPYVRTSCHKNTPLLQVHILQQGG